MQVEKIRTRTQNASKNLYIGMILHFISLLFSFVGRTIFIKLLGEQYLGISGLYSNILQILSLADLGVSTGFTFSLYKPLANKDFAAVSIYLNFFKKIFRIISAVVFLLGTLCVPLLPFLVKDSSIELNELQVYFMLSVANSACSYLAIYKSALLRADQKEYIIKLISTITTIVLYIVQIVVLYLTKNYALYLISGIIITLLNNFIVTVIANRIYPQILKKTSKKINPKERKSLLSNIKSLMIYKTGAIIINSTDNILISVILGTVMVGYYSNYSLLVSTITALIAILINAVLASIGNLGVEKNSEKNAQIFHMFLLIFNFIATFCSCCFLCVINDFIFIWLKEPQFLLSQFDVVAIIFTFFITCISNPIWMFRESFGYFKKAKYIMLYAAIINIILSIVGGLTLGIGGIILATGISRIVTMFWYEPRYLYKDAFNLPFNEYWKHVFIYGLQAFIVIVISFVICNLISSTNLWMIIIKIIICFIISTVIFVISNMKTHEGKFILEKIKTIMLL